MFLIKSRKKKFCLMIFLCFFFYPFVPTLAYIVNLWHMNGSKQPYNAQKAQLELFARVSHSITGCIEAPFQLIMTTWLIMKGVLDIPWRSTLVNVNGVQDRFENQIPAFSIPMWTLCFSIIDILGCSIQINIFNVYIGQLRNFKSAKRYFNLVGGHFPFFFHAVCFRILTFSFLMIYLDTKAGIPLFLIWLSNIIIGYATVGKHKIPRKLQSQLKRMQSVARQDANLPKITSDVRRKKTNENTPVWLNSFLSIFVPSCFVHTADPALLQDDDNDDLRKEFLQYEKKFQRKVIKYQVQTSTTFLMLSLALVFVLVNFTEFQYNNNIFDNDEFNVLCCMILGLGIISYLFMFEIDVYDLLHLNDKPGEGGKIEIVYKKTKKKEEEDLGEDVPDGVTMTIDLPEGTDGIEVIEREITTKKHGPCKKTLVTILFTLLAVSPVIAGFTYSHLGINNPAYLVMKIQDQENHGIIIQMAKSKLLNNPEPPAKREAEGFLRECKNNLPECSNLPLRNEILLIVMDQGCFEELNKMPDISCLPVKGIVMLESWDYSSSRPVKFNTGGHPVTKFPIITISYRDANATRSKMQENSFVNIIFDDFDSLLEEETSDIYEVTCPENGCTSMGYPALQEKSQIYIGCDGETKLRSNVNMTCTSNGKRCPELETWKKQIDKGNRNFESCFGKQDGEKIVFPPAHCIRPQEGKVSIPKACNGENDFWNWRTSSNEEKTVCWNNATSRVKLWKKECKEEKECKKWGSWSDWIKSGTCHRLKKKERFRFCRNNKDCVLIEWEKKYGRGKGDDCTWTGQDDVELYDDPPACKYDLNA